MPYETLQWRGINKAFEFCCRGLPKVRDPSGGLLLIISGTLKKNDQNILNGNDLENGKGLTNWKMKIVTSDATKLAQKAN